MDESVKQEIKIAEVIKTFDTAPGSTFMANEKKYVISETFTIGRFEKVEELEEELLQFSDQRSCHQVMLNAMKKINEMNPGEAYMLLFNKIDIDQKNAKIIHFTLRLCTAYINYEGEDLRYLSEETMKQKINDWSEEGLDARPFLRFAVTVYTILFELYKKHILNILTEAVTVKQSLSNALDIRTMTETADSGSEK